MKRTAFTLVELLVVIAIIGLLSTVAVIATSSARDKARIAAGQSFEQSVRQGVGDVELARWNFNEGSGATLNDSSGNRNNVTLTGTVAGDWTSSGFRDGALNFSGSSYGDTGISMSSFNNGLTFAAWVKTSNFSGGWGWPFSGSASGNTVLDCGKKGGSGEVTFETSDQDSTTGVNIADNNWHFLVCTFDPATQSKKIYVDGALKLSVARSGIDYSVTGHFRIGKGRDGVGEYWIGTLDEEAVYGRALSASRIERLYAEGRARLVAENKW